MRRLVAFVLLLIGALLVPVSIVAWWAHDAVVSADGYVATVAPLAKDPAVVAEVEDRLTTATTQRVADSTGAPAGQVRPLVRLAVQRAVADPAFGRVWRASNRDVHRQVVAVLRERSTSAGPGSTVGVQLAPVSVTVREELVAAGIPFADRLPTVRSTLPLLPTDQLARARGGYAVLDAWGPVLPFVTALVFALGLLAARRRAGSLAWTALASLAGLGLVLLALVPGRIAFAAAVPGAVPATVARAVFDTVTAGLRHDLLVVAVGAGAVLMVSALVAAAASTSRRPSSR